MVHSASAETAENELVHSASADGRFAFSDIHNYHGLDVELILTASPSQTNKLCVKDPSFSCRKETSSWFHYRCIGFQQ